MLTLYRSETRRNAPRIPSRPASTEPHAVGGWSGDEAAPRISAGGRSMLCPARSVACLEM